MAGYFLKEAWLYSQIPIQPWRPPKVSVQIACDGTTFMTRLRCFGSFLVNNKFRRWQQQQEKTWVEEKPTLGVILEAIQNNVFPAKKKKVAPIPKNTQEISICNLLSIEKCSAKRNNSWEVNLPNISVVPSKWRNPVHRTKQKLYMDTAFCLGKPTLVSHRIHV